MPVGPSHGGGSHSHSSSGGSRSSGSSSSYSSSHSSSSYSSSRHSTCYVGGGGGYYGSHTPMSSKEKKKLWLIIGIVIFSITAIIGSLLFSFNIGSTLLIRKDAREYKEIIERANNHEEGYYLITINDISTHGYSNEGNYMITYGLWGDHDSSFEAIYEVKRNGVYYFYLTYSFVDDYGRNLSGESYTAYSESAVKGLSSMTFAYTLEYDKDGSWDIIDVNYSLKTNMDYWKVHTKTLVGLFMFILFAGLDAFFIYMLVRVCKEQQILSKKEEKNSSEQPSQKDNFERMVCEFCGTMIGKSDKKCPSCGGTKFVVTKIKKNFKE